LYSSFLLQSVSSDLSRTLHFPEAFGGDFSAKALHKNPLFGSFWDVLDISFVGLLSASLSN
jgi:hypothetical protein